jgi:glycosyltransferase involved in cell wall biosynthesis/SAM-dependent methyltransferase
VNACTIIARNYLAYARALADSFLSQHPESQFTVLLLDDLRHEVDAAGEPFDVVRFDEIGISEQEQRRMAMIYDVLELSTAVKPWFLRTLLERGRDHVVYLDPDIWVFDSLAELEPLAREHSIVLTPHVLEPMVRDGHEPSEQTILLSGIYNLGFIAVGATQDTTRLLDWWSDRLRRDCLIAHESGYFVDQRWIDFVPALFDHHIVRDPGYNVAPWNLPSRRLSHPDGRVEVNGRPLRFFHFSGFDPRRPDLLSKFQGANPRIAVAEDSVLTGLCAEYSREVLARGHEEANRVPYAFNKLPDGTPIDAYMRRVYRHVLVAAEAGATPMPPEPFAPETAPEFSTWIRNAVRQHRMTHGLKASVRGRLAQSPRARAAYHRAQALRGRMNGGARRSVAPPINGVNVAGYFRAELGVGEAGRAVLEGVKRAGVPYSTVTYGVTSSRQDHPFEEEAGEAPYDVNVVCVNADRLLDFRRDRGDDFFEGRYTVGVWWWEVADFPTEFHGAYDVIDEVWVGSRFVRDSIAAHTTKPVLTMPIGVNIPPAPERSRADLELPEGFLFLFVYDLFSILERKNPLGLIDAFKRAFAPGEGPTLVLKSINGDRQPGELARVRNAAAGRDDILVVDRYLSLEDKSALMQSCDCYVSLHRSEGFGLTMAEAMGRGKPVIATAYSGNVDFMTEENAYLVPYELAEIPEGCWPYPAGSQWADPDLDAAAAAMRRVVQDRDDAEAKAALGRDDILRDYTPERTAAFVTGRLDEIPRLPRRRPRWSGPRVSARGLRALRRQAAAVTALPASPPATNGGVGNIERAERFLAYGPENPWDAASRLGPLGTAYRRALRLALHPHVARQRDLETAVVAALRDLEARIGAEAAMLASETARVAEETSRLGEVTARVDETVARIDTQKDAIAARLARVDDEATRLREDLKPLPVAPELRVEDEGGREAIGFTDEGDGDSDGAASVYLGFESVFRLSEDVVRDRQRMYAELLRDHAPVLDVGCGRGELLELLRDGGIEARGIDIDEGMVARCREKGLDVEKADALAYLEAQPDASIGAVFSAQVVEHLGYAALLRFLELAHAKLAPGGVFLAESVNPHSVVALRAFWLDPTHEAPLYPEVLLVFCRLHGFASGRVLFPEGRGDLERDRRDCGDYAVVARKA